MGSPALQHKRRVRRDYNIQTNRVRRPDCRRGAARRGVGVEDRNVTLFMWRSFQINLTWESCALPLAIHIIDGIDDGPPEPVSCEGLDIQCLWFHFVFTNWGEDE